MNNRKVGTNKEAYVYDFLTQNNIKDIELNYRCKLGEIDLLGYEGDTLVVFEVKYRSDNSKGFAAEAVDYKKQKKICKVYDVYRMMNHLSDYTPTRFDVIAIDGENIHWIKNAFEYIR